MSIMTRNQSRRIIEMRDLDLNDLTMMNDVDNESLLLEMDRSISNVMDVIDMENNILLGSAFMGL